MAKSKKKDETVEKIYPRVILGLDVSTVCIGVSIIKDTGEGTPEILKITHISPKIPSKIKGVKALLLRKSIFENEFLTTLKDYGITDVVIEEPLISSNNSVTVATLLRYNGMICDAVYRVLGVVPCFISSYDARAYSFPDLISLRKFNKKGKEYTLKEVKSCIKKHHLVLFGSYPYDVDKKVVMMNKVNEIYPNIEWIIDGNGEVKKENYDACDALVCALAYVNVNRYGMMEPKITQTMVTVNGDSVLINYRAEIWGKDYDKTLTLINS
jgi:hypothetical protein